MREKRQSGKDGGCHRHWRLFDTKKLDVFEIRCWIATGYDGKENNYDRKKVGHKS